MSGTATNEGEVREEEPKRVANSSWSLPALIMFLFAIGWFITAIAQSIHPETTAKQMLYLVTVGLVFAAASAAFAVMAILETIREKE